MNFTGKESSAGGGKKNRGVERRRTATMTGFITRPRTRRRRAEASPSQHGAEGSHDDDWKTIEARRR